MSETNFTEQDRELLRAIASGAGIRHTTWDSSAASHAIAEIDSLRAKLGETQTELGVLRRDIAVGTLGMPSTDETTDEDRIDWLCDGFVKAAEAVGEMRKVLADRDSLRAQFGEAQAAVQANMAGWRDSLRKAETDADTLRSEVERTREALRLIQWGITVGDGPHGVLIHLCPHCDQSNLRGHAPDCEVGAALAGEPKPVVADCATTQPTRAHILSVLDEQCQQLRGASTYLDCEMQQPRMAQWVNKAVDQLAALRYRIAKAQSETGGAA